MNMSYNKTVFNTPTIYIDIQEDFDRTLGILVMMGQVNKIREMERVKKEIEHFTLITEAYKRRSEHVFNQGKIRYDEMKFFTSSLIKKNKNVILRTPSGRFGSTHKEIDRFIKEGFDNNYKYRAINGIYSKMNKQQRQIYFNGITQFVNSLAVISLYSRDVKLSQFMYIKATERHAESSKQLKLAEANIVSAKTQLKKLGFVAIIKMMNDIEKKARRYKL